MRDLFFIVRMIIVTIAILLIMQIQIDNETLEEKSLAWIRSSPLVGELQKIADTSVIAIKKLWANITSQFSDEVFKDFKNEYKPGQRLKAAWTRSQSYLEEKAKKANEKMKSLDKQNNSQNSEY